MKFGGTSKPMRKPFNLRLYLYSAPNLVGSLLGLAGLGLHLLGVIQQFWLLIVIGLYGIGVLATPKDTPYDLRLRQQISIEELRAELENAVHKGHRRLPKEAYERVKSIRNSVVQVLPQINDLGSSDHNIYLIQQTALDYLPASLEAYMNLPKAYANYQPIRNGKTARQLLIEQLDLLDREMKEVVQEVYRNDTQQLIIHGRFLQDTFQKSLLDS